jgi:ArsR family transcriptional regulator, arsenate/arsenite/antimonite-responsive transcriptional repressor
VHAKTNIKRIERVSKALADPYRIMMLEAIKKQKDWMPCSTIVAMFDLAQSTVSHHMKQLVDADLVILEKEGRTARYKINKEGLSEYLEFLNKLEE